MGLSTTATIEIARSPAQDSWVDGTRSRSVSNALDSVLTKLEVGSGWYSLVISDNSVSATAMPTAYMRFVEETRSSATYVSCLSSSGLQAGPEIVSGLGRSSSGDFPMNVSDGSLVLADPVNFAQASTLRLCIASSASFSDPTLLSVQLSVTGLQDACTGDSCLASKTARCYGAAWSSSNCLFSYSAVVGDTTLASWTTAYPTSGEGLTCGADMVDYSADATASLDASSLEVAVPDVRTSLSSSSSSSLSSAAAVTVAICFCTASSDGNCASEPGLFSQQVGILYVYNAYVCHPSDTTCESQFGQVVVGHPFRLRIDCPMGGCSSTDTNRVKLVEAVEANNKPSWKQDSGCRSALQLANWKPSLNCLSATNCQFDGGSESDYKEWGEASPYWRYAPLAIDPEADEEGTTTLAAATLAAKMMFAKAERSDLRSTSVSSDVCYCDSGCEEDEAEWFKVGSIEVLPFQISTGSTGLLSFGLTSSIGTSADSGDVLGLQTGGGLKLFEDDDLLANSSLCNSAAGEVVVLAQSSITTDGRLSFHTPSSELSTGLWAVCYCGQMDSNGNGEECGEGGFFPAGHITVEGPRSGQEFTFNTGGVISMNIEGYGLQASDELYLSGSPCEGGVAPTAWASTGVDVYAGCPSNCATIDETTAISIYPLSSSAVNCDENLENCEEVLIISITNTSTGIELLFDGDPTLSPGDKIVLGDGLTGATDAEIETLRGEFSYRLGDGSASGSSYVVAHEVRAGTSPNSRMISLMFDDFPSFEIPSSGLPWGRTDEARTKHEMVFAPTGVEAAAETLYLCWKSSSSSAYRDAGSAAVGPATSMPKVSLVLPTRLQLTTQPAILAFKTSSDFASSSSSSSSTSFSSTSRAVVRFENMNKFHPRTRSGSVLGSSNFDSETQGSCGVLLLEAWTDQSSRGFPMPQSCQIRTPYVLDGAQVLDFEITFEPGNGLLPDTGYQLVFNSYLASSITIGSDSANSLVRVLLFDDVEATPSQSAEGSYATTTFSASSAILGDYSDTSMSSSSTLVAGVEVLDGTTPSGGSFEVLELDFLAAAGEEEEAAAREAFFRLRLTSGTSGLSSSTRISTFLRPFSLWELTAAAIECQGSSCAATVTVESFESEVGQQANVVTMTSVSFSPSVEKYLAYTLTGQAKGGFFQGRPLVVASMDYVGNQLVTPTGAYLHQPVTPAASLLTGRGDGNSKPFVAASNRLYAMIVLTTGLPVGSVLSITAPPFFETCDEAENLPAGSLLNSTEEASGVGRLSVGSWAQGSTNCTWKFEVAEDLLAGRNSIVHVALPVTNPTAAVTSNDSTNSWQVSLSYEGLSISSSFVGSSAAAPSSAASIAVIPQLPSAQVVPGSVTVGTEHTLSVFFETSMGLEGGGVLQVEAPPFFAFDAICEALSLDDTLYRLGASSSWTYLERLPTASSCTTSLWPLRLGGGAMPTITRLVLSTPLMANRRYGFGLSIRNAKTYNPGDQLWWAIQLETSTGEVIERSRGLIAHISNNTEETAAYAWGLYEDMMESGKYVEATYQSGFTTVTTSEAYYLPRFRFGELQPYPLAYRSTSMSITPIQLPFAGDFTLRITAPLGYAWESTESVAKEFWDREPAGATEIFPGEFPALEGTYATWNDPLTFESRYEDGRKVKYGLNIGIRLPWWPETNNKFLFEFDFSGDSSATQVERPLAAYVDGPSQIQVIRGAQVDYLTGLVAADQEIRLTLEIATVLLPDEGLILRGGVYSSTLSCSCTSTVQIAGTSCDTARAKITDELLVIILVTDTMLPGTNTFSISCTNPSEVDSNVMLWTMGSYDDPTTYPLVTLIDSEAYTDGFSVKAQLATFERWVGKIATGFDPRPLRRGSTILVFALEGDADPSITASSARLRAPLGTVFEMDCLHDIATELAEIFGGNFQLALGPVSEDGEGAGDGSNETLTSLPSPRTCYGREHLAWIKWLTPLERGGVVYAMSITVTNPATEPATNVWTLEVDEQASQTIPAAPLQRFLDVSLVLAQDALRLPDSVVGGSTSNRVAIGFTATVEATLLRVYAASSYTFGSGNGTDTACHGMLLEGVGPNSDSTFPTLNLCHADGEVIDIYIQLLADYTYALELEILTPTDNTTAGQFLLFSTKADGEYGDEGWVASPTLTPSIAALSFELVEGSNASRQQAVGQLSLVFPDDLGPGDILNVEFPKGFDLDESTSECPIEWGDNLAGGPISTCSCTNVYEQYQEIPSCSVEFVTNATESVIDIDPNATQWALPWPSLQPLTLTVKLKNPRMIATILDNFLIVSRKLASSSTTISNLAHVRPWGVSTDVTSFKMGFSSGSAMRAGVSEATLCLTFTPANSATILRLQGLTTIGWDFTAATLCYRGSCWSRDETEATILQVQGLSIESGLQSSFDISGVRLAKIGGTATFELETFKENQKKYWVLVDIGSSSLQCPGELVVSTAELRTEQSVVNDPTDVLWSQLFPRVGVDEGVLVFDFHTTLPAAVGDWLSVQVLSGVLSLSTRTYAVVSMKTNEELLISEARRVNAKKVVLVLGEGLFAGSSAYRVHVASSVAGDLPASPMQFVNVSLCRSGLAYPRSTNDAILPTSGLDSTNWFTSRTVDFVILDIATAPLTQIQVVGSISKPANNAYNWIDLIAPPGVKIVDPCSPTACDRVEEDAYATGQVAARGLPVGDFKLVIVMPEWWTMDRDGWLAVVPNNNETLLEAPYWEVSRKLSLRAMPTSVFYAASAGELGVSLVVNFTIGSAAAATIFDAALCYVLVQAPEGYAASCGSAFRAITLPEGAAAQCFDERSADADLIVKLTSVRFTTTYDVVLAMSLDVPETMPDTNHFQITVRRDTNVTADANTQVQGKTIPATIMRLEVFWLVEEAESLSWVELWVAAAVESRVFQDALATVLEVQNTTVTVQDTDVVTISERRLQASSSVNTNVSVTFSIDLLDDSSSNTEDVLLPKIAASGFLMHLSAAFASRLAASSLQVARISATNAPDPIVVPPPQATNPELYWPTSVAQRITTVTISLTFVADTLAVSAVLFVLPNGFQHQLEALDDMYIQAEDTISGKLAIAEEEGSWLHTPSTALIRLAIEKDASIEAGTYHFKIPVYVPAEVPILNVWFMALCSTRNCTTHSDDDVIVSFAMPGFNIGERHPDSVIASGSLPRSGSSAWMGAIAALILSFQACR